MKKVILFGVILLLVFGISSLVLSADENWPTKPIRLILGSGAGGSTDMSTRLLASILEKELGQPIICENKSGGTGTVAASIAATQEPDGYHLFTLQTGPAFLAAHTQDIPFDPLKDFTFISRYAVWQYGLVVQADSPWNTFQDFLKFAKENPGEISYGLSGTGSPQHLVMERLGLLEEIEWKAIPFKGSAESIPALMGGHVNAEAGVAKWAPQVLSGDFRLLAVFGAERMKEFPEVPTLKELGYDIVAPSLLSIAGPAGIPEDIVERLDQAIKKAVEDPEFIKLIDRLRMRVAYLDHEEFAEHVKKAYKEQGEIIKKAGLAKEE